MNFVDYCIATKNFSALDAVEDYTKSFALGTGKGLIAGIKDAYRSAKRAGYKGLGDMLMNLRGATKAVKERRAAAAKLKHLRNKMDADQDMRNLLYNMGGGSYQNLVKGRDKDQLDALVRSGRSTIKNAYKEKGYDSGYKTGKGRGWDDGLAYGLKRGKETGYEEGFDHGINVGANMYKDRDKELEERGQGDAREASRKAKLSIPYTKAKQEQIEKAKRVGGPAGNTDED